jgi:hypothetical protein
MRERKALQLLFLKQSKTSYAVRAHISHQRLAKVNKDFHLLLRLAGLRRCACNQPALANINMTNSITSCFRPIGVLYQLTLDCCDDASSCQQTWPQKRPICRSSALNRDFSPWLDVEFYYL